MTENLQKLGYEDDSVTDCSWCTWNGLQRFGKIVGIGKQGMNRSHLDHKIVEMDENTEKCPGGLRKLIVTQTPVKNHQLKLIWKTHNLFTVTCFHVSSHILIIFTVILFQVFLSNTNNFCIILAWCLYLMAPQTSCAI